MDDGLVLACVLDTLHACKRHNTLATRSNVCMHATHCKQTGFLPLFCIETHNGHIGEEIHRQYAWPCVQSGCSAGWRGSCSVDTERAFHPCVSVCAWSGCPFHSNDNRTCHTRMVFLQCEFACAISGLICHLNGNCTSRTRRVASSASPFRVFACVSSWHYGARHGSRNRGTCTACGGTRCTFLEVSHGTSLEVFLQGGVCVCVCMS